jgi:hypothetical protein
MHIHFVKCFNTQLFSKLPLVWPYGTLAMGSIMYMIVVFILKILCEQYHIAK